MTKNPPSRRACNPPGLTRRDFLTSVSVLSAAYWLGPNLVLGDKAVAAPIPGGTLAPGTIPKFVTPLVIPPPMPPVTTNTYRIAVRQFTQPILPAPLPPTTVWSYGSTTDNGTFNYPAFTIEATRSIPTTVTWLNELKDDNGNYRPHLLPVDPTLHWANPPGGAMGRDMRPRFTSAPVPYTGPVPIVTHVHGMGGVADWSDGYAEAWYLPEALDIPMSYATEGTWYEFFKQKAQGAGSGLDWGPGRATFQYPNSQRPSTAWYHDHTLGMTRLNVYAGPAGFYIIRSNQVADNPTVAGSAIPAILPSGGYEIPIAIQDRSFNADGSLFYPNSRAFFDAFLGPYIPGSEVAPIWNPEFFGNCIVVNGKTWPYLEVEPRRYRFRLLNGCQSRSLILNFDDPQVDVWQIGNEGGYLRAPVPLKAITMGPAERADVIVDFARVTSGANVTLRNRGPDAPLRSGGFRVADPQTTGLVMQFRLTRSVPVGFVDPTTPPLQWVMPLDMPPPNPIDVTRSLALLETMAMPPLPAIPVETRLGTFEPTVGAPTGITFQKWEDPVTENPTVDTTEIWELYNFTADVHPIHLHEVFFEVVNRQPIDKKTGLPTQKPRPPAPTENGYKDTVLAYPGEVTRIRMRFTNQGQFVWHCHIVEHEDNEMMRPYRIGPVQPGQPHPA